MAPGMEIGDHLYSKKPLRFVGFFFQVKHIIYIKIHTANYCIGDVHSNFEKMKLTFQPEIAEESVLDRGNSNKEGTLLVI